MLLNVSPVFSGDDVGYVITAYSIFSRQLRLCSSLLVQPPQPPHIVVGKYSPGITRTLHNPTPRCVRIYHTVLVLNQHHLLGGEFTTATTTQPPPYLADTVKPHGDYGGVCAAAFRAKHALGQPQ